LALAEPDPSTLADAPGVCALWLVLAPALAWPGVTDAFPEAEPLADVCAIAVIVNKPAIIAAIQNFLMFNLFLSLLAKCEIWGTYGLGLPVRISDAIYGKSVYSQNKCHIFSGLGGK
jgi:hypothetical protein